MAKAQVIYTPDLDDAHGQEFFELRPGAEFSIFDLSAMMADGFIRSGGVVDVHAPRAKIPNGLYIITPRKLLPCQRSGRGFEVLKGVNSW